MTRPLLAVLFFHRSPALFFAATRRSSAGSLASIVMIATQLAVHGAQAFEERVVEVANQRATIVVI